MRLFLYGILVSASLLLTRSAEAGIIEFVCDETTQSYGLCYSDQLGKTMTLFSVTLEGVPEAQCPHEKADLPECQAARLVHALSPGWQMAITCQQSLVDAGVCHRTMLGKSIGNPLSQRQFADRELRLSLWTAVSQDWRRQAQEKIGPVPTLLLDGKLPP